MTPSTAPNRCLVLVVALAATSSVSGQAPIDRFLAAEARGAHGEEWLAAIMGLGNADASFAAVAGEVAVLLAADEPAVADAALAVLSAVREHAIDAHELVVGLLDSPRPEVRARARIALSLIGPHVPRDADDLLADLSADPRVAAEAATQLIARRGIDEATIARLALLLAAPTPMASQEAERILRGIGDAALLATTNLLAIIEDDAADRFVRSRAFGLLLDITDRSPVHAKLCLEHARDRRGDLGYPAIEALCQMVGRDRSLLVPLMDVLDDCDHNGRMQLLNHLRSAAPPAILSTALPRIIPYLGHSTLHDAALSLVVTLGPDAAPAVPRLLEVATGTDPARARSTIDALGELAPIATTATPSLIEGLGNDDPNLVLAALAALGEITAEHPATEASVSGSLVGSLRHPDRRVRERALCLVVRCNVDDPRRIDQRTFDACLELAADDAQIVRDAFMQVMPLTGPRLRERLAAITDEPTRTALQRSCDALADGADVEPLLRIARDRDDDVALVGLTALRSWSGADPRILFALRFGIDQAPPRLLVASARVVARMGAAATPAVPGMVLTVHRLPRCSRLTLLGAILSTGPTGSDALAEQLDRGFHVADILVAATATPPALTPRLLAALSQVAASDEPTHRTVATSILLEGNAVPTDPVAAADRAELARIAERARRGGEAMPEFLAALRSPTTSPAIRAAIVQSLSGISFEHAGAALELVVAELGSPHPAVRDAALHTVRSWYGRADPALRRAWLEGPRLARDSAGLMLAMNDSVRQRPVHLARRMLDDPSPLARGHALDILIRDDPDDIGPWLDALADPSPHVRARALQAMIRFGPRAAAAAPRILAAVQTLRSELVWPAIDAAGAIGPAGLPILRDILRWGDQHQQLAALQQVQRLGAAGRSLLDEVVPFVEHSDATYAAHALDAIGAMRWDQHDDGVPPAAEVAIGLALQRDEPAVAAATANALGTLGSVEREWLQRLIGWSTAPDPLLRRNALVARARLGAPDPTPAAIVELLSSQVVADQHAGIEIVSALTRPAPEIIDTLIERVRLHFIDDATFTALSHLLPKLDAEQGAEMADALLTSIRHVPIAEQRSHYAPLFVLLDQVALDRIVAAASDLDVPTVAAALSGFAAIDPSRVWQLRTVLTVNASAGAVMAVGAGGERAMPLLPALLEELADPEFSRASAAAYAIAELGPRALPAIELEMQAGRITTAMVFAISLMGSDAATLAPDLARWIDIRPEGVDPDQVVLMLARLGPPGVAELEKMAERGDDVGAALEMAIRSPDPATSIAASRALTRLELHSPALRLALLWRIGDRDQHVATWAAIALLRFPIGDEDTIAAYRSILDTAPSSIRRQALGVLARHHIAAVELLPWLVESLFDSDPGVRRGAAAAIRATGDAAKPARRALDEAATDPLLAESIAGITAGW